MTGPPRPSWRPQPGQGEAIDTYIDRFSVRTSGQSSRDRAIRAAIERVCEEHTHISPVGRSKRRTLDVIHALGLGEQAVQWFYDRRDGRDLTSDHAHAMALLPTGQLVDLTARQFDPDAPYPLFYPSLEAVGRDWRRYQLVPGLGLRPEATAELPARSW